MPHDIFISHSAKDGRVAKAVCDRLEADGMRCWISSRDIMPGSDWSEEIIDAIEQTKVMVVILSSHANASPQIKREAERALNKGVIIVPFRIEDVRPSKSLEYYISTAHFLDASSPPIEPHLGRLSAAVSSILEKQGQPRAPVSEQASAPRIRPETPVKREHGGRRRLAVAGLCALLTVVAIAIYHYGPRFVSSDRSLARQQALGQSAAGTPVTGKQLYLQMTEEEKRDFVAQQARRVAGMLGRIDSGDTINEKSSSMIKAEVDRYANRTNSLSVEFAAEGLRPLYSRAAGYAPIISNAFRERGVPPVMGLYIVMIESEYRPCLQHASRAKGMFSIIPETGRAYGIDLKDLCDVKKAAPVAAQYIKDLIAEFGTDSDSVTLALASYNRGPK